MCFPAVGAELERILCNEGFLWPFYFILAARRNVEGRLMRMAALEFSMPKSIVGRFFLIDRSDGHIDIAGLVPDRRSDIRKCVRFENRMAFIRAVEILLNFVRKYERGKDRLLVHGADLQPALCAKGFFGG